VNGCAPQATSDNPIPSTNVPTATDPANTAIAPTATNQTIATNAHGHQFSHRYARPVCSARSQACCANGALAGGETSRVVKVHHSGAWAGADTARNCASDADDGLSTLTGVKDKLSAARRCSMPESALLKVNCIDSSLQLRRCNLCRSPTIDRRGFSREYPHL
jgi:hypothetical protein